MLTLHFFSLTRQVKPLLSQDDFEKAIHAFINFRLDYCNALHIVVNQSPLMHLRLVQNAVAHLFHQM